MLLRFKGEGKGIMYRLASMRTFESVDGSVR